MKDSADCRLAHSKSNSSSTFNPQFPGQIREAPVQETQESGNWKFLQFIVHGPFPDIYQLPTFPYLAQTFTTLYSAHTRDYLKKAI